MSTPSAAFILQCPACGKKYKGNPEKPNSRYKCPADQNELVRPEAVVPPPLPPAAPAPPTPEQSDKISLDYETTQRMTPPPESNYEATQQMSAQTDNEISTGFDYQATQKIEIETQSYEQTQKIETPSYEPTQRIDSPTPTSDPSDMLTQRHWHAGSS